MMDQYPYTNFHELNLDWIIQKVKEAYSPDNPPDNLVLSVNGQTGDVVLYQNANVMLPTVTENIWNIFRTSDSVATGIQFNKNGAMERINGTQRYEVYDQGNPPDYPVDSVNGQTGAVVLYPTEDVQFPSVEDESWTIHRRIDGSNSGLLFIKNVKAQRIDGTSKYDIYDAGNPPPYPVTSVNGQTGAVTLTFPVTSVNGQTGAVVLTFPVTSVNGQTGDVVIPQLVNNVSADYLHITQDASGDEWAVERGITSGTTALRIEVNNGHVEAYLDFTDTTDTVVDSFKLLTTQDIPSSAGVVSVNGSAGVVVLTGSDIAVSSGDNTTIATKLSNLQNSKANQDTLAFMEPGDTATQNIPAGRYVYWKGNMYKSSSAISQYDTLSLSNLTAVSPNALNDLQGQVTTLSDQIVTLFTRASEDATIHYESANTWTKANKSVTIPANKAFGIYAVQSYNDVAPGGLVIGKDSSNAFGVESANRMVSVSGITTNSAQTFYVWGKGGGAGTNVIAIYYWYA